MQPGGSISDSQGLSNKSRINPNLRIDAYLFEANVLLGSEYPE
jgi:hypothetical protein